MAQHRMEASVVQAQETKGREDKWPSCRCSWQGRSSDFFPSKFNRKLQHKLGLKFSSAAEKKVLEGQEWESRWLTLAVVHVRDDDSLSSDSPVGV